jgi:glycosyltransferase involved in cell wall biosynthesis
MDVSLIVCSRNRADSLSETLASIVRAAENEPKASVELIVVDNGSTDRTSEVVDTFARTSLLRVRRAFESRVGLSSARNTGLRIAKGAVVALTDDDCRLSPDYLTDLLTHYAADVRPVLRGGRIELGDMDDLPITIKTHDRTERLNAKLYPGGFVHGANMTFARNIPERIGGFDQRFGAGSRFRSAEDADFIYRAFMAGFPVEYVPDMTVVHWHGRRQLDDAIGLHENYDFGDGALYAKQLLRHPAILRFPLRSLRRYLRELRGKSVPKAALDRKYGSVLYQNARGFLSYCRYGIVSRSPTKL